MHASAEYQRSVLHHKPRTQARNEAELSLCSNRLPCYEHQTVFELAETTVNASQALPLCERHS